MAFSVGFYLRGVDSRSNTLARVSASVFFVGCALTHADLISHAYPEPSAMDYASLHHLLPVAAQLLGAATFTAVVLSKGARGFYFHLGKQRRDDADRGLRAGDRATVVALKRAGHLSGSVDQAVAALEAEHREGRDE